MSPDVLLECPRTSFRDVLRVNVTERVWHSPHIGNADQPFLNWWISKLPNKITFVLIFGYLWWLSSWWYISTSRKQRNIVAICYHHFTFEEKKIIVSCDTSAHQLIQQGMNRDPGKLELKSSNVSHFSTFPFYLALIIGWFNANLAILYIKRFCHPILIQIWQSCTMAMVRHGRAFMAANSLMNKSNIVSKSNILDKSNNGTSRLLDVFSSLHTFRQVFAQVKGCLFQSMHKTRS